jgi:hypothetical protein
MNNSKKSPYETREYVQNLKITKETLKKLISSNPELSSKVLPAIDAVEFELTCIWDEGNF